MIIGRILGWILILGAIAVTVSDLLAWRLTGTFTFSAAGEVWFRISPTTLELAQPAIQRHLAAWLWDPVVWVLRLPALAVLAVPGIVLVLLCLPTDRKRRRLR
jgi:hypothetical protein